MKTRWKVLLVLVAVVCFAIALSYPINYQREKAENEANMAKLAALREAGRQAGEAATTATPGKEAEAVTPALTETEADAEVTAVASAAPQPTEAPATEGEASTPAAGSSAAPSAEKTAEPTPTATPDRRARTGALAYPDKEKVVFDEKDILPEFQELYEMNHDLVGWLTIPGTKIDYPVVQCEDSEYYLTHDFFGKENKNGQIILDTKCDPYTPSYNLVISGHNMFNENMFGPLLEFVSPNHWKRHKLLEFDVLTEKRQYVIFAAFASADYDVDEEGFRYNADIQYRVDAERWLEEVRENQMYKTDIDVAFGDEFLTLTTCNRRFRKNGRMVVVCRRIRDGEEF